MKKSELKIIGIWILLMSVFIGQLLFYTWCRVQCVQAGYEISQETEKHRKLMLLQNNLKIELARLKSPDRIARIAEHQLGLKTPGPEQMIILSE
ncbi:cell division protein FtsL [Desulfococcaceae bacterium HSG8]|nr:cell division protein FtsL [Desulfococcaceae bacterium HSG8]